MFWLPVSHVYPASCPIATDCPPLVWEYKDLVPIATLSIEAQEKHEKNEKIFADI